MNRRFWLTVLAVGAFVLCGTGPVCAAPDRGSLSFTGESSPSAARAAAPSAPCVFKYGLTACASSNPRVAKWATFNGDTAGCRFAIRLEWGDGSITTLTVNGGKSGPAYLASHAYTKRGVYAIEATGNVLAGPCYIIEGTNTFTLGKVTGKLRLAALGDSFSSGEGAGHYDKRAKKCHRSVDAWPRLLAENHPHITGSALIACSGARSTALQGDQAGQPFQLQRLRDLRPRPTLVTLTMGGNDVGFSRVLKTCISNKIQLCRAVTDKAFADIRLNYDTLIADYRAVRRAAPRATILVVGYPRLFPGYQEEVSENPLCTAWLVPEVRTRLNELTTDLNHVIAAAARTAGVNAVNVTNAFSTHEICTAGTSWISPPRPFTQEAAHPEGPGQAAIAKIVRRYVNNRL